ncbi:MAG: 4Fe-4S dicluster domain-containing protein, partial [Chloroflexota bacterium]|nr:4Fe-4S dicluster domain-containing protein [Chloroflexota bacterium]
MAIETKLPRGRAAFTVVDVPRDEDLYKCVHCGLCLNVCPTYTELLVEPESPRGRIALMKAVSEGRLEMTPRVVSHWELCLQCRACEAICPSGVPYGRLMEHT